MVRIEKTVVQALVTLGCWDFFRQRLAQARSPAQMGEVADATRQRAKQTYRERMVLIHPDKPTGDEALAKQLNAAWSVVKELELRAVPPPPPPPTFTVIFSFASEQVVDPFASFSQTSTSTVGFF